MVTPAEPRSWTDNMAKEGRKCGSDGASRAAPNQLCRSTELLTFAMATAFERGRSQPDKDPSEQRNRFPAGT